METARVIQATFADWRPAIGMPERQIARVTERFLGKIIKEPNSGCWLWDGTIHPSGYGYFSLRTKQMVKAHRFSYARWRGHLPDHMHVLHKCDTPACVRPDHLFLGTPRDNAADREQKGRGNHKSGAAHPRRIKPELWPRGEDSPLSWTANLRRGEGNPRAKLSREKVAEIIASGLSMRALGRKYAVSKTQISRIKAGKSWKHAS